jgi:hypothetical protein
MRRNARQHAHRRKLMSMPWTELLEKEKRKRLLPPSLQKNAIQEFKNFLPKNAKVAYKPTMAGLGWRAHTYSSSLLPVHARDSSSYNKKRTGLVPEAPT